MDIDNFVKLLKARPYLLDMGAGKLSKCHKISREDVYRAKEIVKGEKKSKAKILIFDIETTPLEAYVWQSQVWKARVTDENIISQWYMLTWSAKWLGSNEMMSMRLTGKEVKKEDDKRIVKGLWRLLNEADIVVAHNGDSFDVPNINSRFIINGLFPTTPYQTIDTKKIAAKQFGFTHNSLNALGRVFGLGQKIGTDFDLWKRCKDGNEEALMYMEEYNRGDVDLLEDVYLKLRPWIKGHPNVALYMDTEETVCHVCGSLNVEPESFYFTGVGKYPTYRCKDCGGAVSRGRKSVLSKEKRENLVVSIAK
jgi:hypothetical protein